MFDIYTPEMTTFSDPRTADLKDKIIKHLYFEDSQSCAKLSEKIQKSIPLIAKGLSQLLKDGFVVEKGYAPSSGGRRPLIYSLVPDTMFILAVAMDQISTQISLVDLHNKPAAETKMFELKLMNNPNARQQLVDHINTYLSKSGIPRNKIAGAGIGMPGFVNTKEGINYTYLDVNGQNLQKLLAKEIGLPVYLDNDSSLVALAELKFGLAKAQSDVMVINVGWGIGLGMILNGQIFRGHSGFAGEFSHIPLSDNGALCECGKRGCLEAEASMLVVAKKAIAEIKEGRVTSLQDAIKDHSKLAGDAIMEAANKGDQYAIELISDAGYKIGIGLSTLIHLMNPETIVLSGRGAMVGKILLPPVQQALNKYCIPRLAAYTDLLISEIGYKAELIGSAALVMENYDKV